MIGHSALPQFVLWKAGFAGLQWDPLDSHKVQESETGTHKHVIANHELSNTSID